MIYKFIDNKGTFTVDNPQQYNLYFPLTNSDGTLLSSISPNLGGDIKSDNNHFITPPATIIDSKDNILCRRDFFLRINNKTIRLSDPHKDKLEAGLLYHKLIKKTSLLDIEILNFIPSSIAVEIMSIKITNKSSKSITITPTSLIPFYGRGENTLRDHRHVSSLLNRIHLNRYGLSLKPTLSFNEEGHKINNTTYFCLGFQDNMIAPLGQFPTIEYFSGNGNLSNPQSINQEIKPITKEKNEFQGKETLASFRFKDKKLKKGETVNYFLITGMTSDSNKNSKQKITKIFSKINSPAKIKKVFEETQKYWLNYLAEIEFDFKNKNFNNWLLWVKLQPTLRKLFGCSFLPHFDYGKGGRGWRDLWQDALTLLITEPTKAKTLLLESFKGIRIDGTNATIITKNNDFSSDRNKINRVWSDHGIWPFITLSLYINKTGDLNILNKNTTYFRDHLLMRSKKIDPNFKQQDFILRNNKNKIYQGSILEHLLVQHLTSFFNVGKHNVIRLENADWNDGLDMASELGESVTFSFMYAHNLKNICYFLKSLNKKIKEVSLAKELVLLLDQINQPINYNNFKEKQKRLEKYFKASQTISGQKENVSIDKLTYDLEKKSNHLFLWLNKKEWLSSGFFNGYYDNKGKQVEGKSQMNLSSQVFAIMSGIATDKQIKKIWTSIKKHLYDKTLGGFRLNTNFGHSYLDLGRAYSFAYGDKENGSFFSHMVVMLANALYRQNYTKEGSYVLNSIYKMATSPKAQIYPLIPEYFNNQGKGLYSYLTGSASWYIYTLVEEILGLGFELGDIVLNPKIIPLDFFTNTIETKHVLSGKIIRISYIKGKSSKIKKILLQGKEIPKINGKYIIKRTTLTKINKKEIFVRIYFL